MALMKENIILPCWIAFYSFKNLRAVATIMKSRKTKKNIRREYMMRVFQITFLREPIFANIMSAGYGAELMTILVFLPYSN